MKIKVSTQDARLLQALLGGTFDGLFELYDDLTKRLNAKGYETLDYDDALTKRLKALVGTRVANTLGL